MEEANMDANGADAVKKKSFLTKILPSKWLVITVLILCICGYVAWWGWGADWWMAVTATGDETHQTQVATSNTHSAVEALTHDPYKAAEDLTHGAQTTHQAAAQKQDSHGTGLHVAESQHTTSSNTTLNKSVSQNTVSSHTSAAPTASATGHGTAHAAPVRKGPRGVTFVEACIQPLDYELNQRFLGWRPNDIIRIADNIKNLQLGILEVTRRTAVALAENLSRTGSTDAYVPSLEYAMNSFMIKPTELMFPSAEGKYQEALDGWKNYQEMLQRGEARFYRRVDNLVPLLKAYESILGSCDENLVKQPGELSTFKADDVFYYAKGVAIAMGTILGAVALDFDDTIGSDQGMDVLHHTVEALHHASSMDPWIVLEGSPDGILANHRANIAAPISHARFYLDVLSRSLTGNL
nr:DUF2333 family protein [uncultured Desulfobacter sp.]